MAGKKSNALDNRALEVTKEEIEEAKKEVAPFTSKYIKLKESYVEKRANEIALEKKKAFNPLEDRKLKPGFISMVDVISAKGKKDYAGYKVHARFLNKILGNPNFNVVRIEDSKTAYAFNITGIEGRYNTYNQQSSINNSYIHEIVQENTKELKAEILEKIEHTKQEHEQWYDKKGYHMAIDGVYDVDSAVITLRTDRTIYKFITPKYALNKHQEEIKTYVSDYKKVYELTDHIKEYEKLVKYLEIAIGKDLKYLATWIKHDIQVELKSIDNAKKLMQETLSKVNDFKAMQYNQPLQVEA